MAAGVGYEKGREERFAVIIPGTGGWRIS